MSFILRSVSKSGDVTNTIVGSDYKLTHKQKEVKGAPLDDFQLTYNNAFGKDAVADCFAFLVNQNVTIPMFGDMMYYVMTESGSTFERIECPDAFKK